MALMEWRCNYQAFGRGIQPAITNSPTHLIRNEKEDFCFTTTNIYHTTSCRMRKEKLLKNFRLYVIYMMEFYPIIAF